MKQLLSVTSAVVGLLVLLSGPQAFGQARSIGGPPTNPYSRPTVSPYVELLRRGDPGINYYRRIRPEVDLRTADSLQIGAIQRLERRSAARREGDATPAEASQELGSTGHPVYFMNYSHYFRGAPR
jgi:hypothetical protein